MTRAVLADPAAMGVRHHLALHLAHRWFAFLESEGGDIDAHLEMFHPRVRLSGRRGDHVFADDRASLLRWFASVPEEVSSHHIIHSSFVAGEGGVGQLSMVVAYQAPQPDGMRGSIISYETTVEFVDEGARFLSLDKTPILANASSEYHTSWAANRVLALVHAELASTDQTNTVLSGVLGCSVSKVMAVSVAQEGARDYHAVVTAIGGASNGVRVVRLALLDDLKSIVPIITRIEAVHPGP